MALWFTGICYQRSYCGPLFLAVLVVLCFYVLYSLWLLQSSGSCGYWVLVVIGFLWLLGSCGHQVLEVAGSLQSSHSSCSCLLVFLAVGFLQLVSSNCFLAMVIFPLAYAIVSFSLASFSPWFLSQHGFTFVVMVVAVIIAVVVIDFALLVTCWHLNFCFAVFTGACC